MISKDSNATQEGNERNILLTVAEIFRHQGEQCSRQSTLVKFIILFRKKQQSIAVLCFVVRRHFLTILLLAKLACLQAEKIDHISDHLDDIEQYKWTVDDLNPEKINRMKTFDQKIKLQALADLAKSTQEALQEVQISMNLIEMYRDKSNLYGKKNEENGDESLLSLPCKQQSSSDSSTTSTQDDDRRCNVGYDIRSEKSKRQIRERDFDSSEEDKPEFKVSRRERDWNDSSEDESLNVKSTPMLRERDLNSSDDED